MTSRNAGRNQRCNDAKLILTIRHYLVIIANYIDIYTDCREDGGMKAYGLDLRERIVSFVSAGGSKVEAAQRFGVARKTVYNYLTLDQAGKLPPKASWGSWKKFEPAKVRAYVAKHPDATLWEIGRAFQGTDVGALSALRLLGITLKKTRQIPGKK